MGTLVLVCLTVPGLGPVACTTRTPHARRPDTPFDAPPPFLLHVIYKDFLSQRKVSHMTRLATAMWGHVVGFNLDQVISLARLCTSPDFETATPLYNMFFFDLSVLP